MSGEQEALIPDQGRLGDGGLWRRFVKDRAIDHGAWVGAIAEGQFVGNCRKCGGFLVPLPPEPRGAERTDYAARCRGCGAELNAPGGKVARGSTRRSERK